MAANPFASLFAGFGSPAGGYSTPNSALSQFTNSLKKKDYSSLIPANPSATTSKAPPLVSTPTPTAPNTPNPLKSTAGQDYLKSLSAAPEAPLASAPMTTPSGLPITGDPSKYAGVPASPSSTPSTPSAPSSTDDYKSAFADYIKTLTPSEDETAAAKNLADLNLQAEKDQEEALSRGETQGFATGEAARVNRNNSFGITAASNALDALTRSRSAMTDAQKARLDFTKSLLPDPSKETGFTLGPNEKRYDAQGNLIAGGGSGTGSGTYVEGANPTVDAYVKAVKNQNTKLENVPEQYRDQVAQGLANAPAGANPQAQRASQQADTALTSIDNALNAINDPSLTTGSAIARSAGSLIPGTKAFDLAQTINTVKALIGFDQLQKMREASPTGGALGQVSEKEIDFLQSVAGSLNIGQSTSVLKDNLNRIRQSFETLKLVNSPDGTVFELDGKQYQKQGDEMVPVGFKGVGGDTNQALNVPQRNKNPGNLKSGGLADSLAIGKDSQGHLIFPSAEVGFQALAEDLGAKLSGRSTKVGPNPTIAQLGAVYAEDPNWATKVAKLVGASTSTRTNDVDFNKLLQAVATQEGFYA